MRRLSTKLTLFMFGLNVIDKKEYSKEEDSKSSDVYVFNNDTDYYNYYLKHNLDMDKEIFELPILFRLKNGDIIALKGLCDRIINKKTTISSKDENKQLCKKMNIG